MLKVKNDPKEYTNDILTLLDKDIISVAKVYSPQHWEDIAQETRIHMWQVIENNYIKKMTAKEIRDNIEDILFNCSNLLIFYCNVSKKAFIREQSKYQSTNLSLDSFRGKLSYDFSYHHIDFEVDYNKYCQLLDKRELQIFEYLCKTNPQKINYDAISRELGYTSKNGFRYILVKIAQKISDFDEKNLKKSKK